MKAESRFTKNNTLAVKGIAISFLLFIIASRRHQEWVGGHRWILHRFPEKQQ